VAIGFLFGLVSDSSHQRIIEEESRTFGDIIQSSAFQDTYMNLTLKSMSMLRWTQQFCHGVKLLLKADDDMFIRIDNLLGYYEDNKASLSRKIFGDLIVGAKPVRDKSSKWFLKPEEFNGTVYPTYTSGTAYVISGDLIANLTAAASRDPGPYIPWEDVYITGVLAQRVGASRFMHKGFSLKRRPRDPCAYATKVTGHRVPPEEILWLWEETKKLLRSNKKC